MNVFARAASMPLPTPAPPADFNVKVGQLAEGRAAAITRAVEEGQLQGFICGGQLWVRRGDLHDLLPAGHCTFDPKDDCCFIPGDMVDFDGLVVASAGPVPVRPSDPHDFDGLVLRMN
jgi:hypothetical protein